MSLDRTLQRVWYERAPFVLFLVLIPLSLLFAAIAALRRCAFRMGLLRVVRVGCPVLIVGNVSVGGTGKTPLVIWIAEHLAALGCRVGIVTRGYGGRGTVWPQYVTPESPAGEVGDEAVLLACRTHAIVVAGPDRVAAAKQAIEHGANVIVSDDGLQHYRLGRDAEVVVIDAQRGFGNRWLLPAGPLREPISRVRQADIVIETMRTRTGARTLADSVGAEHALLDALNLRTGERRSLASFAGEKLHAVAGIGHPEAFFAMLRAHGIELDARALADHAELRASDVAFDDTAPVLMTEKDAVKCRAFANERHWAVPLTVRFSDRDEHRLIAVLEKLVAMRANTHVRG
jgi:tetraacyldisaccharide 4'-kinase